LRTLTLEEWSAGLGLVAGLLLAIGSLASWWKPVGGGYESRKLQLLPWARGLIITAVALFVIALALFVIALMD
jgi:hypothetical protein